MYQHLTLYQKGAELNDFIRTIMVYNETERHYKIPAYLPLGNFIKHIKENWKKSASQLKYLK